MPRSELTGAGCVSQVRLLGSAKAWLCPRGPERASHKALPLPMAQGTHRRGSPISAAPLQPHHSCSPRLAPFLNLSRRYHTLQVSASTEMQRFLTGPNSQVKCWHPDSDTSSYQVSTPLLFHMSSQQEILLQLEGIVRTKGYAEAQPFLGCHRLSGISWINVKRVAKVALCPYTQVLQSGGWQHRIILCYWPETTQ